MYLIMYTKECCCCAFKYVLLKIKKAQIEEFKSAMLDLIKYQKEQQLSLQKQQMGNQRRIEELRIEIQRQKLQ